MDSYIDGLVSLWVKALWTLLFMNGLQREIYSKTIKVTKWQGVSVLTVIPAIFSCLTGHFTRPDMPKSVWHIL